MYSKNGLPNLKQKSFMRMQIATGKSHIPPFGKKIRKAIFNGWYKEPICEKEFDFDEEVITGATSIYAKWLPDNNENSIPDDKEKVVATDEDGEPLTIDPNDPIVEPGSNLKPGDTFTDEDGNEYKVVEVGEPNVYTGEMPLTVGQILKVKIYLDGGTLPGYDETFVKREIKNHYITIPEEEPIKDGYEFDYWQGSKHYPSEEYKVVDNHNFKAIWKEASTEVPETKYTDVKDKNGNPVTPKSILGEDGTALKVGDKMAALSIL